MLTNPPPVLRYDRNHHWQWLLRRVQILYKTMPPWFLVLVFWILGMVDQVDTILLIGTGLALVLWLGILLLIVGYRYVDWRMRNIRLYSDGRLEYEYGIWVRRGVSVSLRFGTVRYHFRDRMSRYLDCADIILPFEAGVLEDICEFHLFWGIAQGRF